MIDYTAEEDLVGKFQQIGAAFFDHIVDHVGVPDNLYYQCHLFSQEEATFVQVGASSMLTFVARLGWPSFLGSGEGIFRVGDEDGSEAVTQLGEWVADGTITMQLDSVFEIRDAVKAYERLRSGRSRGKIVIHVSDPSARNMEPF